MHIVPYILAAESAGSGNVLDALGIDVRLLIFQIVAFAILVWVMGKFVFPIFIKAIDDRQARIETGLKEAAEAQKALEQAETKADDLLAEARKEAEALLARSQEEAAAAVLAAETKAKTRAEQIVADARTQLDNDVKKARAALKKDTVQLVALATERIVAEKVDAAKDKALIERSLEEAEV